MAKKARAKTPKDQPLTGMEDARIPALEKIARDYADIRDQRIELNRDEAKLKERAIRAMHEYKKAVYKRNGIEIRLDPGEETLKVRIKAEKADDSGVAIEA